MENARFKVDVSADPRTLHEVYLPHFKRVVDEGVASVMSAYNSVNGEWCGQNKPLLTDILREQWGFQGFVQSDWMFGMRDARKAALAGQCVEMPLKKDGSDVEQAAALAKLADVAIVVAGYDYLDEDEYVGVEISCPWSAHFPPPTADDMPAARLGAELSSIRSTGAYGGDRDSLALHEQDERLIAAVADANPARRRRDHVPEARW